MSLVRVASLGSGSKGNATVIEYQNSRILIDSGFSCKELEQRLTAKKVSPASFSAVLVTHEHSDHFNGVAAFSNRYDLPVWMSSGTSLHSKVVKINNVQRFNSHFPFSIDDLVIQPIAVPHDSREACQFVVVAGQAKIGLLTDLGHITPYIVEQYNSCNILLLEFNHDFELLMQGKYPASLKSRVAGNLGHLNNVQALGLLEKIDLKQLKYLVAMHLSDVNNSFELVESMVRNIVESNQLEFQIASQEFGFDWIEYPLFTLDAELSR